MLLWRRIEEVLMGTIWFCLVAFMIVVYVLLDGFDLGAGAIHILVAKTDEERRQVLASIGPVWDGNEVWLIAAGGTMYFAFPSLYASSFSGFYLPLMLVLWLLILRGMSIEFRNHIKSAVWDPLWDFVFCVSSLLLLCFSERRWVMWCVACPWMEVVFSLNRCGRTSASGMRPAFWTGTPCSWAVCHFSLSQCTVACGYR